MLRTIAVVWAASALIGPYGNRFVGQDGVQWDLPDTLILAMGFSSLTLLGSKGITAAQVQNGTRSKTPAEPDIKQLVNDDDDTPDLLKTLM